MNQQAYDIIMSDSDNELAFRFLGLAHPDAPYWATELHVAEITTIAPPFTGTFDTVIGLQDLATLQKMLQELWHSFTPHTTRRHKLGNIELSCTIDTSGHAILDIRCTPDDFSPLCLRYRVRGEQMKLQTWIQQIGAARGRIVREDYWTD